jgi:hypothetical protein
MGRNDTLAADAQVLLESNALIKQRDWIDGQLEPLSTSLLVLAANHGLT